MRLAEHIYFIEDFLTKDECDAFIRQSEKIGYESATIKSGYNLTEIRPDVRNNQRVIFEDVKLATSLFGKAKRSLPTKFGLYNLKGLNERFRFYKYDIGEQFKMHQDSSFERNKQECSFFTFLIYLNDNFEGGETVFQNGLSVLPKQGSLLLFYHPIVHSGAPILKGTKYILRTDVMYKL